MAGHVVGRAEHHVLVPLHQRAEGLAFTVLATLDGLVFGHACSMAAAPIAEPCARSTQYYAPCVRIVPSMSQAMGSSRHRRRELKRNYREMK